MGDKMDSGGCHACSMPHEMGSAYVIGSIASALCVTCKLPLGSVVEFNDSYFSTFYFYFSCKYLFFNLDNVYQLLSFNILCLTPTMEEMQ